MNRLLYVPGGIRKYIINKLKERENGATAGKYRKSDDKIIHTHLDKYLYVVHKVVEQKAFSWSYNNNGGYAQLSKKYLRKIIGARYEPIVIADLISWGIIQCDGSYVSTHQSNEAKKKGIKVAAKSYGYCLQEPWSTLPLEEVMIMNEFLERNLNNRTSNVKLELSSHQYLYNCLGKLDIDRTGALKAVDNIYIRSTRLLLLTGCKHSYIRSYKRGMHYNLNKAHNEATTDELQRMLRLRYENDRMLINSFTSQDAILVPDPYGRVHTPVTNISSVLRPFLFHCSYRNQSLAMLDIVNSQAFFLGLLLKEAYIGKEMPDNVRSYITVCSEGRIYEFCMDKLGISGEDARDYVKSKIYQDILFCHEEMYGKEQNVLAPVFRQYFPDVLNFIQKRKEEYVGFNGYKKFSYLLQETESLYIQRMVKECQKKDIWLTTIHDCLVCLEQDKDQVRQIMQQVFEDDCLDKWKTVAKLKTKVLSAPDCSFDNPLPIVQAEDEVKEQLKVA